MFYIKFINLTENTIEFQAEYESLFDALRVCKETNLSSSYHRPAMSDSYFNEHLFELLTSAMVYTGTSTPDHPAGEIMITLTKDSDKESVYSALEMPRIPSQSAVTPVAEDFSPEVVQALYTKQSSSPLEDLALKNIETKKQFVAQFTENAQDNLKSMGESFYGPDEN